MVAGFVLACANLAHADEAVLAVAGEIAGGERIEFSISSLEEMGTEEIATRTPWHDGPVRFEGVPLAVLAKQLGVTGGNAVVEAFNNYQSQIPVSDFFDFDPILAMKKDGAYMTLREKGPFFVVYPYDRDKELQSELYYSRSVWQVRSITFE